MRKREAEAVSNEIDSIDAMMGDIHSLLSFSKDDRSKRVEVEQSQKDQEYDRLASQLVQEAKGKATDRHKSQEECKSIGLSMNHSGSGRKRETGETGKRTRGENAWYC